MANIMVCVTKQRTCQRLIKYGQQIMQEGDTLHVIHIAGSDYNFLGDSEENKALEYLYESAREAGADLTVFKSDDVFGAMCDLVAQNQISKLVVGTAPEADVKSGFLARLESKLNGRAQLVMVPAGE